MLIYLAGAIRPTGTQTLKGNINKAKKIALELWGDGYAVICPHANTDLPTAKAEEFLLPMEWLNGDLQMIARCDALVVVPDWENSQGTKAEIVFAEERDIPVYYYPGKPPFPRTEATSPIQCRGFLDIVMSMYRVHLKKNADYSPANILGTGEIGLVTRLWDKMARLMNLTGFRITISEAHYEAPLEPKNESIDDAYMDASVYNIIGLLLRQGKWGK